MKKKIFISAIVCLIIIIGIIGFINWNNRIVSTITLDINPSLRINIMKNGKVKNVVAINDDAKDIIKDNYTNKTLDETFELIANKLIDNGYVKDNNLDVILYVDGLINNEDVAKNIEFNFGKKDIHTDVIVIESINKEDEDLAEKYNISPAKANYLNTMLKDNENLIINSLIDKNVSELKETKETGNYCDKDYTLEGDFCIKEIGRENATFGKVCPIEYYEYNGKCYKETPIEETDTLKCRDEFTLEDGKCIRRTTVAADVIGYTCSKGEVRTKLEAGLSVKGAGDANDPVCVDPESETHPVSPCELPASNPTERMSYGGKCYWHRAPVIESGCPGKIQVNGYCWDDASNVYLCPSNSAQKDKNEYCYTVLKNVKPTVIGYKCNNEMTLNGSKCVKEEIELAEHERICQNEYTKVNNDRCINLQDTKTFVEGYICEKENSILKNNECIIYEKIAAKHN